MTPREEASVAARDSREACFPRFGNVWLCMCGCWNGLWPWCGRCSTFRWNLDGEISDA